MTFYDILCHSMTLYYTDSFNALQSKDFFGSASNACEFSAFGNSPSDVSSIVPTVVTLFKV